MLNKSRALAQQEQVEEIMKCAKDPVYFITTYMKIFHPVKGVVDFDLYPFQKDCIEDFLEFKYNIILKSRQLGLSTVTAAYCLWFAMFHRAKNIVIMATKLEVGKNMVGKIREAFQLLPAWMLEKLNLSDPDAESVKYIKFSNGSKITAIPTAKDAGRSEAVSLLVVDEAAHIENLKELWLGIKPTLSTGGKAIVFSTPAGKSNFFYELWVGAETKEMKEGKSGFHCVNPGKNGFHAIKLPWMVHPERDDEWFKNESASMDDRGVAQEMLCDFSTSGFTYFQQSDIESLKATACNPITYSGPTANNQDFWIWKLPQANHKYIIAADIARGDAEDFSAFHVIDTNASDIAGEYVGKIPTDDFGVFLDRVGRLYNNALLVIESNSYGVATGNKLKDLKYPNLYYDDKAKEKMENIFDESEKKMFTPGFYSHGKIREIALTKLEECIRKKLIKIYSMRFANEMDTFVFNGKRGQATKGKHDDLIMALAIGLQIFDPNGASQGFNDPSSMAIQLAMIQGFSRSTKTMSTSVENYGKTPESQTINPYAARRGYSLSPVSSFINSNQETPLTEKREEFNGKLLPPGVKREHVEQQQMIYNEFGWLLK